MKNKLVLTGILLPLLLVSGCKKGRGNSDSSSLFFSDTSINSSSSSETKESTIRLHTDFDVEITSIALCGASITDDGAIQVDGMLADGSVNHITGNVYAPSADGKSIAKETSLLDEDFAAQMERATIGKKTVYTAIAFAFSLKKLVSPTDHLTAVFFDNEVSTFETGNLDINKAYRIGFISDNIYNQYSNGVSKVWAPLQSADNCTYVSNMDDLDGTSYTNDIIDKNYSGGGLYAWHSFDDVKERNNYLGYFPAGTQAGTAYAFLNFAVVIWVEGTDPECMNRDIVEGVTTFTSNLSFNFLEIPN